ncbi:YdcF family protein [Actinosynnema sp. NPDC050436]|uniref:YdcF family protein n=1 Tax=Actinosynnema sp. NPDC050436 TaxID=3155659 RepID=UPI0033D34BC3
MKHPVRPADIGIGFGSHDIGVAVRAVELYHARVVPQLLFTGANAPTTVTRFPRGEAVHYREHALAHAVPDGAILVETEAGNTGENVTLSREVLRRHGVEVGSAVLISRPSQERRVYATCRMLWPGLDVVCTSRRPDVDEYVASVGDVDLVISTLVGDTQRITLYAEAGHAIAQHVPDEVHDACGRLVAAGYTSRYIATH